MCEKILAEAKAEMGRAGRSSHEKHLSLCKLMDKRDGDVTRAFNDFRRSTALIQIGIIHSMGLFTAEELRRFSPETIDGIEMYARIRNT